MQLNSSLQQQFNVATQHMYTNYYTHIGLKHIVCALLNSCTDSSSSPVDSNVHTEGEA